MHLDIGSQPIAPAAELFDEFTPAAMREQIGSLVASDAAARILNLLVPPADLLTWMHSAGVCNDKVLASLVPELPPEALRAATAAPEADLFLYSGLLDLLIFVTAFRDAVGQLPDTVRVLDFGCGCGRLLRFFAHAAARWKAYGADVNADLAEWCSENGMEVVTSKLEPPLPFDDGAFDLGYAFSVFTHLDETASRSWMAEMGRLVRPGGILLITTHGVPALRTLQQSEVHQRMMNIGSEQARKIEEALPIEGATHVVYDPDTLRRAAAGETYGNTFVDPAHAAGPWAGNSFEVVRHVPGGMRAWQDLIVLRRLDPEATT